MAKLTKRAKAINEKIDRNFIDTKLPDFESFTNQLLQYAPIFVFLGRVFIEPISSLILLLFYSFLTHISTKISGPSLSYKKCFQIGLHLITFAELVQFLQSLLLQDLPIPSLFSIAYFGGLVFVLFSIDKNVAKHASWLNPSYHSRLLPWTKRNQPSH